MQIRTRLLLCATVAVIAGSVVPAMAQTAFRDDGSVVVNTGVLDELGPRLKRPASTSRVVLTEPAGRTQAKPKPGTAAKPAKPVHPVKAADPAKPPEPARLAEPVKPPEPARPAEPIKPPEPAKLAEPVKPPEPPKVAEPAKQAGEAAPTRLVGPLTDPPSPSQVSLMPPPAAVKSTQPPPPASAPESVKTVLAAPSLQTPRGLVQPPPVSPKVETPAAVATAPAAKVEAAVAAPAKVTPPPAKVEPAAARTGGAGGIEPHNGGYRLRFAAGDAALPEGSQVALESVARKLEAEPQLFLQLLAYAEGTEDEASKARRLSLSRALAVRSYLMNYGVRSTRIEVRALGNKVPEGPADRVDVVLDKR